MTNFGLIPEDISALLGSDRVRTMYLAGFYDIKYFVKYFLDEEVYYNMYIREYKNDYTKQHVVGTPKHSLWLYQFTNSTEGIIKAGSRSGKTHTVAIADLWSLFYMPRPKTNQHYGKYRKKRYQILNVAPSLKQAKLVQDYIETFVKESNFLSSIGFLTKSVSGNEAYNETIFNSYIEYRPSVQRGKFILGQFADLISVDECASDSDLEHLRWKVLKQRTKDTSGKLIFISTPQGEGEAAGPSANYFRRMWDEFKERKKRGENVCLAELNQFDNPTLEAERIWSDLKHMTESQKREEVFGKFATRGDYFFSGLHLASIQKKGECKQFASTCFFPQDDAFGNCVLEDPHTLDNPYLPKLRYNEEVYSGLDIGGGGKKADATVLITLKAFGEPENPNLIVSAYERVSGVEYLGEGGIIERIKRRLTQFNGKLFYDATSLGGSALRGIIKEELPTEMMKLCQPVIANVKPNKSKYNNKRLMLSHLQWLIESEKLIIPYDDDDRLKALKQELRFYQEIDDKLSCDTVMALALAAYSFSHKKKEVNLIPLLDATGRSMTSLSTTHIR